MTPRDLEQLQMFMNMGGGFQGPGSSSGIGGPSTSLPPLDLPPSMGSGVYSDASPSVPAAQPGAGKQEALLDALRSSGGGGGGGASGMGSAAGGLLGTAAGAAIGAPFGAAGIGASIGGPLGSSLGGVGGGAFDMFGGGSEEEPFVPQPARRPLNRRRGRGY